MRARIEHKQGTHPTTSGLSHVFAQFYVTFDVSPFKDIKIRKSLLSEHGTNRFSTRSLDSVHPSSSQSAVKVTHHFQRIKWCLYFDEQA